MWGSPIRPIPDRDNRNVFQEHTFSEIPSALIFYHSLLAADR